MRVIRLVSAVAAAFAITSAAAAQQTQLTSSAVPAPSPQSQARDASAAQQQPIAGAEDRAPAQPQTATAPQTNPPATTTAQTPPATPENPPVLSHAAGSAYDRRDSFPNVNVYLPEGQASVRLRKLIRNVLFESQIDYRFVNGDISTFLRYKYYARNFTYRLGVFDQIGFPDVGSTSTKEFERVRGGLLLFEFPRSVNNRYYWLLQDDRLTFGDTKNKDNRKNNIYTKVAYLFGTQSDERLNGIAGETRGRVTPVLTAFRDLGPQRFSLAAALTQSARIGTGDYRYTKFESEAIRRTDVTELTFVVSRLHAGIFPTRGHVSPTPVPTDTNGDGIVDPVAQYEFYTIPRYELFTLGGREGLRSQKDSLDTEGTNEAHLTNEYFVPLFRNRDYRTWLAHWNTLYGIGYLGAGGVAFEARDVIRPKSLVVDAGLGTEAGITIRDFEVILSLLYARAVHAPDGMKRGRISFSIRTIR